ncbi:MAG: VCBS repeat-containing protein, partial [Bacteroidota bacterium]
GPAQLIEDNSEYTRSLYTTDLDSDGDLDVLTTSINDQQLKWYENIDGEGTFNSAQEIHPSASFINCQIGDFDGDNDIDIVASEAISDAGMSWFRNEDGQGNFSDRLPFSAATIQNDITRPHPADIDGDGDLDLLYATSDDDRIAWSENLDGQGTFLNTQIIADDEDEVISVFPADLDGDGDLDVAAAAIGQNDRLVWYENLDGQGTFGPANYISFVSALTVQIAAFDADGDGDMDLVSARRDDTGVFDGGEVYLYRNDGNGDFGNALFVGETNHNIVRELVFEDLDDDGDIDILVVSYNGLEDSSVNWFINSGGEGLFNSSTTIFSIDGRVLGSIALGDFDGDGDKDLIAGSMETFYLHDDIYLVENLDGQGSFGNVVEIDEDSQAATSSIKSVDMDNDGDMDILCASGDHAQLRDQVSWYENLDGAGTFGDRQIIDSHLSGIGVVGTADFDDDGVLDIYCTSIALINWYENQGDAIENRITGQIKIDINEDNCASSTLVVPNQLVSTHNTIDTFSTFSFQNGTYQFKTVEGTFTTSALSDLSGYTVSPNSIVSNFAELGLIDSADFCYTIEQSINDVSIELIPVTDARAGFTASYLLIYKNLGTTPSSGTINLDFDGTKIDYLNSSELPSAQTANQLTWTFNNLNLLETRIIDLDLNILPPPAVNFGDTTNFHATILPDDNDVDESNNQFLLAQNVIGAFDPNDIRVLEGEKISWEDTDEYLHYIIRFQNTGNAAAINVIVENQLSPLLDPHSLQLLDLSHDYRVEISNNRAVSFIFEDINLPDSTSNLVASQGYIVYKIRPVTNISIGDSILNDASIFFDFNPPILTNTVSTRVVGPPVTYTDVQTACDSLTWINGITYFESIDSVGFLLECAAQSGADSLVLLDLNVTTVNTEVSFDDGILFALNQNATYQWIDCANNQAIPGATSNSFTPTVEGEYALEVTENNCTKRSGCTFVLVVDLEDQEAFEAIKIFPNPNQGQFTVDFGSLQILQTTLRDISGQVVFPNRAFS